MTKLPLAKPLFKCYTLPSKFSNKLVLVMEILLSSDKIAACTADLAKAICSQVKETDKIAVVGIRSRGEILAKRLTNLLSKKLKSEIPCGTLDITLYRDDLNEPHGNSQPFVRTTEIAFDINDKIIILVDDVLHTGRSTRAAMDALIDLGRPKAIRLAVLVERTGREFPIQSDFAGIKINLPVGKSVQVNFIESDGKDEVAVITD